MPKYEKYADFALAVESGIEPASLEKPKGMEAVILKGKELMNTIKSKLVGAKEDVPVDEDDIHEKLRKATADLEAAISAMDEDKKLNGAMAENPLKNHNWNKSS